MRDLLHTAWRARHVLLVGQADRTSAFMQALLLELGARPARIAPCADAETLCRAMTEGRISAVIVPRTGELAPGAGLNEKLSALLALLGEAREAGIPLVILCSDAGVYRAGRRAWAAQEEDPIGGESREGFIDSILQMTADGVSRGLLGDAVSALIVRHPPCLGCGHPAVQPYTQWCRSLDAGDLIDVPHPGMQGVFMHPLDMCCGTLLLGARFLLGDTQMTGVFNLSADAQNILANRTAALRFVRENGGTRPIRELHVPLSPSILLPDGAKARLLCGVRCLIPAADALSALLELERAAREGGTQEASVIAGQTQRFLQMMLS